MPFNLPHPHLHSHSNSSSSSQPALSAAILQSSQSLGSFGAPTGNLTTAIASRTTTTAPSDRLYSSSGTTSHTAGQAVPPNSYGSQHANSSTIVPPASGAMNHSQQYETPRRRHPDELHLNPSSSNMAAQRGPVSPRDFAPSGPRISLEQAPEPSQYHNAGQLPGSLQPGRPGAMSLNSAPNVPTAPQTMSQEQYSSPSRSSALGLSHNYTRSSPANFDGQGYAPFTPTTPSTEQGQQFISPSNSKFPPQGAQRTVSNTPLGLADIRPRADSGLSEGLPGANPYSYDGANAVPTNSNYLAPWAIYAFDWCKWPAQNHDAGKVAVGSYLEDGHNFVSSPPLHYPQFP